MEKHTLKEGDWSDFIQKNILPNCIKKEDACTFALVGDLGAGKTTFSKTFLHALGVKQHVQSPTFSIINSYDIPGSSIGSGMTGLGFTKVFHIDVYRIEDMRELEVLHIDEIFSNPQNIVVIEWADKIKAHISKSALWIYFKHDTLETRVVEIDYERSRPKAGSAEFDKTQDA